MDQAQFDHYKRIAERAIQDGASRLAWDLAYSEWALKALLKGARE